LAITISAPPVRPGTTSNSSINARIRKIPRPEVLESGGLGYAETHLLGEIYALDLRLQRDFEVLRVCAHAWGAAEGK
jgi:hypothetical protein